MIAVPLAIFCLIFMLLCLVLLCVASGRFLRTPAVHPDRAARWDTVRLLVVVSGALGLALARTQVLSDSRPFLGLSVALVPCGIIAVWLMARLVRTYRREKERPKDLALPDVETLQSRISPPFDGRKQG